MDLGLSNTLYKEYSPKGSPYAEYYQANGQVISQKMFGLRSKIAPEQEKELISNSGLMYYHTVLDYNVDGAIEKWEAAQQVVNRSNNYKK